MNIRKAKKTTKKRLLNQVAFLAMGFGRESVSKSKLVRDAIRDFKLWRSSLRKGVKVATFKPQRPLSVHLMFGELLSQPGKQSA